MTNQTDRDFEIAQEVDRLVDEWIARRGSQDSLTSELACLLPAAEKIAEQCGQVVVPSAQHREWLYREKNFVVMDEHLYRQAYPQPPREPEEVTVRRLSDAGIACLVFRKEPEITHKTKNVINRIKARAGRK